MAKDQCPRCRGPLDERAARGGRAGAYREMSRARGCDRCGVALVSPHVVGAETRLARCAAVRASETLHDRCPDCESRLTRLSLEWSNAGAARVEECSFCGLLVVHEGEQHRVAAIVGATRALSEEVIERLMQLARDSVPPG